MDELFGRRRSEETYQALLERMEKPLPTKEVKVMPKAFVLSNSDWEIVMQKFEEDYSLQGVDVRNMPVEYKGIPVLKQSDVEFVREGVFSNETLN